MEPRKLKRDKRKVENTLERARAKERSTKDSDSNPSVVNRDVLEDTAIVVGELATKKRSVGLNKSTRRAIHHKDPLQRDIRELTNPAEKGQGHNQSKGKGKGKGKKKLLGKGNHNLDQAGSLDEEAGQHPRAQ